MKVAESNPKSSGSQVITKRHLIGGQWVEAASGRTFQSINPSNGQVIANLAEGDAEDIDRAVKAARAAFNGPWSGFSPAARQRVLLKLADIVEERFDELRMLDVQDMGAPVGPDIHAGAAMQAETIRYFAGWPTKIHGETVPNSVGTEMFSFTTREPVGVVGSIIPWNGPLTMTIWKLVPVLATGCTMVLKPAEQASLSPLRIGEILQELDLPPGVVNIVTGRGEVAGAALAAHLDVDKIAFTGSTSTGQEIIRAAAGNIKRVSLELGGKSPHIIFADSDLAKAIPTAAMGVFANSGQICCAGTRVFVERPVYDEVVAGVAKVAAGLKVGDSQDPKTQIGPVVSQEQLARVGHYIELGEAEGANLVTGGTRALVDDALADGYFVAPTVFADVADDMRIAKEEIFGPVASILPFDDVDEAIARSNKSVFGLGAGVWTRDLAKAFAVVQRVQSGVVWVNTYGAFDPAMPFGGFKMSGWGNELSGHALDEYLNIKAAWINATP